MVLVYDEESGPVYLTTVITSLGRTTRYRTALPVTGTFDFYTDSWTVDCVESLFYPYYVM